MTALAADPDAPTQAPGWLRRQVLGLERNSELDAAARGLRPVAGRLAAGGLGRALRGEWLGHAVHPLLTDLPLGCFLGSGLLDLFGGRRARGASRRLIGFGLMAVPPTVASGMVDWHANDDARVRRVGVVHAALNGAMAAAYVASWGLRRRGAYRAGVTAGLAGGALGWVSGYLGGHLSFNLGSGIGDRGLRTIPTPDAPA